MNNILLKKLIIIKNIPISLISNQEYLPLNYVYLSINVFMNESKCLSFNTNELLESFLSL